MILYKDMPKKFWGSFFKICLLLVFSFLFVNSASAVGLKLEVYKTKTTDGTCDIGTSGLVNTSSTNLDPGTIYCLVVIVDGAETANDTLAGASFKIVFDSTNINITDKSGTTITQLPTDSTGCPTGELGMNSTGFPSCEFTQQAGNSVDNTTGSLYYGAVVVFPGPGPTFSSTSTKRKFAYTFFKPIKGTGSTAKQISFDTTNTNDNLVVFDLYPDPQSIKQFPDANSSPARTLTTTALSYKVNPAAPSGLTWVNTANASAKVDLSWTAATDTSPTYNVYRATFTTACGNYTKLTSTAVSATTYSDTTVAWTTSTTKYCYAVTTKSSNIEGPKSTAVVVGPDSWLPTLNDSGITSTIACTSVTIKAPTDEPATATIDYGADTNYGTVKAGTTIDSSSPYEPMVSVSGLTESTTYHYRVKVVDRAGNVSSWSATDLTFTTTTNALCTTPTITALKASSPATCLTSTLTYPNCTDNKYLISDITSGSFAIEFTTDVPADSVVHYKKSSAPTLSYTATTGCPAADVLAGPWCVYDGATVTSHSVTIPDTSDTNEPALSQGQTYYVGVCASSIPGDVTKKQCNQTSIQVKFGADPLTITAIIPPTTPTNLTSTTAKITWTTSKATETNKVLYDIDSGLAQTALEDPNTGTSHSVTLTGLTAGTIYYYRVESVSGSEDYTCPDAAGTNNGTGKPCSDSSATTAKTFTTTVTQGTDFCTVSGTVKGSDTNAALSGANVAISTSPEKTSSTDTQGAYSFADIPASTNGISYTVTVTATNYQSNSGTISCVKNTTVTKDFTLSPVGQTGDLEVTVKDGTTSAGVAGATVVISGASSSNNTTDTNGVVTFSAIAVGSYTIAVSATGYKSVTDSASVTKDTKTQKSISINKGAIVTGTIKDSSTSNPVGGVIVGAKATGSTSYNAQVTTNGSGIYTFTTLEEGKDYTLEVTNAAALGYQSATTPTPITTGALVAGQTVTKDFTITALPVAILELYTTLNGTKTYNVTLAPNSVAVYTAEGKNIQGQSATITSLEWSFGNTDIGSCVASSGNTCTFTATSITGQGQLKAKVNGVDIPTSNIKGGLITVSNTMGISDVKFLIANNAATTGTPLEKPRALNPAIDKGVQISFDLAQQIPAPTITVNVYNKTGSLIRTFFGNINGAFWDFKDNTGRTVPNGVYVIQIKVVSAGGNVTSKIKLLPVFQ